MFIAKNNLLYSLSFKQSCLALWLPLSDTGRPIPRKQDRWNEVRRSRYVRKIVQLGHVKIENMALNNYIFLWVNKNTLNMARAVPGNAGQSRAMISRTQHEYNYTFTGYYYFGSN